MSSSLLSALLGGLCVLLASPGSRAADGLASTSAAEGVGKACVAAHSDGLAQRDTNRLLAAKEEFLRCAEPQCPLEIRKVCAALCDEINGATPSVVIAAVDERGQDLRIQSVTIDRWPVEDRSVAIDVDPGVHAAEVRLLDGGNRTVQFVARAGEKYRKIPVVFETGGSVAQPTSEPPSARRPLAFVLGGIGALALGGFAYFGLEGKSQQRKLDDCKPNCRQGDVDDMRASFLLADISLGVAVASFGIGGYLFFTAPSPESTTARRPIGLSVAGRF